MPAERAAGLVPAAEAGAEGVRTDPGLRAVRGAVRVHQQGVHARGAQRRVRVPHRVLATHSHGSRQLQARALHRAGEFEQKK